ncbi:MAG TPA: S-methyl-5'-thioadenosine phosphorylase [Candidatus Acidoferrales bacterium]|nr:S-methyl-5'-thioadenosine phosphorylase [Candidatus Acidoferrales bacterium]
MHTVGVIGGSGLYEMAGLERIERVQLATPFGAPSDEFVCGMLAGTRLIFLPRHGRGHRILPSEVNFRANIYGMKKLDAEWIIAVAAVGSLREEIAPGHLVVPDQFIDRTYRRPSTFFGNGIVAHVGFADPICPMLSTALSDAAQRVGATVHRRGTYVCMEGPQFSTRAESFLYRQWGAHVIGMTNLQEAKLAREAEICFATLALATDYDCWHETAADVVIGDVLRILNQNIATAQRVIADAVPQLCSPRACACARALEHAIITDRAQIPDTVKRDLDIIIGKYL